MFLQLEDALLKISDFAHVVAVGALRDEAEVARRVALVDVNSIEFKVGLVPTIKSDKMREIRSPIRSPRLVDRDAAPAVIRVALVVGVVAPVETSGNAVAETPAVVVIRAYVCVAEPFFGPLACFLFSAAVAPRSRAPPDVVYVHTIRPIPARALDKDGAKAAPRAEVEANNFKLADPVANARSW